MLMLLIWLALVGNSLALPQHPVRAQQGVGRRQQLLRVGTQPSQVEKTTHSSRKLQLMSHVSNQDAEDIKDRIVAGSVLLQQDAGDARLPMHAAPLHVKYSHIPSTPPAWTECDDDYCCPGGNECYKWDNGLGEPVYLCTNYDGCKSAQASSDWWECDVQYECQRN